MGESSSNVSSAPRREWIKPSVERMVAGSAEAGGSVSNDGGIGLS